MKRIRHVGNQLDMKNWKRIKYCYVLKCSLNQAGTHCVHSITGVPLAKVSSMAVLKL